MAAPEGNKFWMARSTHGRKKKFQTPEILWDACLEYFEWVEENPLWEAKVVTCKGEPQVMTLPKMRAMTIDGLCIFLDIDYSTWEDYRKRDDFIRVTTRAEAIIKNQKFTGAAADLLNANIIARDLGLSDKQEVKHGGEINKISDEEIDARIIDLARKAGIAATLGGEGTPED